MTGLGRKYQLYAVQTSKACNIRSTYTAFIPVDLDTNEYLPTCVEYINPCEWSGFDVKNFLFSRECSHVKNKPQHQRNQRKAV